MKKLIIFASLAVLLTAMGLLSQKAPRSQHEMFKKLPADFKDKLMSDPEVEYVPRIKHDNSILALEKYKETLLTCEDVPVIGDCNNSGPLIEFLYSKRLNDVINIHQVINYGKQGIVIEFYIFKDPEKAKMGLNEKFNSLPVGFPEDAVNRTFAGKRLGDFMVRTGRPEGGYGGAYLLYKSIFAYFSITTEDHEPLDPAIVDLWAEKVLNKIKAGLGEKANPENS